MGDTWIIYAAVALLTIIAVTAIIRVSYAIYADRRDRRMFDEEDNHTDYHCGDTGKERVVAPLGRMITKEGCWTFEVVTVSDREEG